MKILYISVRSDMGGGPKSLFDLVKALKERVPETSILVAAPESGHYSNLLKEKCDEFISIPFRKWSFLSFFYLVIYCIRNKVDLVHSHGMGAGLYSRMLSFFVPSIMHSFHGVHESKGLKDKIKSFIQKQLSNRVDMYICVSESERQMALRVGFCSKNNSIVLPNYIDSREYRRKYKAISKKFALEKFNLNPCGKKTLGVLARLDKHKNVEFVIDAIKHDEDYFLIIAGGGEERDRLEAFVDKKKLRNRVVFLGEVEDIISFFKLIDVYVSASRGEGLPYTVLEAIAMGKEVVLSSVPGHIDLVPNDLLFPLDDINSFLEVLKQSRRVELNGSFSKEKMINKYIELI